MPFYRNFRVPDGDIGIWKLTESPDELLDQIDLSESDRQKYKSFKSARRQTEFLATRLLLDALSIEKKEICYTSSGKPWLEEGPKISISHSADFAAVFLSEKQIGIDIEQCSRNIGKIADRFLHPMEKAVIAKTDNQKFSTLLFWAAKEAVFKCYNTQGINFKEQMQLEGFVPGREGSFTAAVKVDQKETKSYRLRYFTIENNVLAYCVEQ